LPKNALPPAKEMLELRMVPLDDDGESVTINPAFLYFCFYFLKCVVGVHAFNRCMKQQMKISDVATPSDEALALLLLENSERRWTTEYLNQVAKEQANQEKPQAVPLPKYTGLGNGKQDKGFTKKFGGWTQAGIQRYNEIFDDVVNDRKHFGKTFDEYFAQWYQLQLNGSDQNNDEGGGCDHDESGGAAPSVIRARNDLFSDDEDDSDDDDCDTSNIINREQV
jgi:hypothetical protein